MARALGMMARWTVRRGRLGYTTVVITATGERPFERVRTELL
ncbi:hypothetical protein [Amycolatopsis thailandensis]|nr:hypothetical protein [Amycolatopsis thailandensis]